MGYGSVTGGRTPKSNPQTTGYGFPFFDPFLIILIIPLLLLPLLCLPFFGFPFYEAEETKKEL